MSVIIVPGSAAEGGLAIMVRQKIIIIVPSRLLLNAIEGLGAFDMMSVTHLLI